MPFLTLFLLPLVFPRRKEATTDGDAKSAQVRMKGRIKAVGQLKLSGLAGEDNTRPPFFPK